MTSLGYDPAAPGGRSSAAGSGSATSSSRASPSAPRSRRRPCSASSCTRSSPAWPAIQEFGLSFVWTEAWDPVKDVYGALTFVYGTVVTSFIALLLATPISIAIALFLTEIAPRRIAAPIATMVELLAAIPSVVLGLWGILVFGPWVRDTSSPGSRASSAGARSSPASPRRRGCSRPRSS